MLWNSHTFTYGPIMENCNDHDSSLLQRVVNLENYKLYNGGRKQMLSNCKNNQYWFVMETRIRKSKNLVTVTSGQLAENLR
jgi:hypothetical protein